jgi:hypothetical protein
MVVMSNSSDLPEIPCRRNREHVPHEVFPPGMSLPIGWCPGVGDFTQRVTPPADPFAGIDVDEEF